MIEAYKLNTFLNEIKAKLCPESTILYTFLDGQIYDPNEIAETLISLAKDYFKEEKMTRELEKVEG